MGVLSFYLKKRPCWLTAFGKLGAEENFTQEIVYVTKTNPFVLSLIKIMKVKRLDVQNVRSYSFTQVEFGENLNIIYGRNAQGKTTILESLALFSYGRSPRAHLDREVISFGQEESRLRVLCSGLQGTTDLAMKVTGKGKHVMVNRVTKKSLSEFLGHFYAVYFSPDDLQIVKGGPEDRRRFVNLGLSQIQPSFLQDLQLYNHLLNQRNRLLKMRQSLALDVFDEQMSQAGARLITARRQFVARLCELSAQHDDIISETQDQLKIAYITCAEDGGLEEIAENLQHSWHQARDKDLQKGFTTIGPHRDDMSILLANQRADRFGSQGQQRSIVLSLKIALVDHIREKTGEYPVLLLDDVLSELDEVRQQHLLQLIGRTQTILTTTHPDQVPSTLSVPRKVFETAHGILSVKGA